jgi:peptidase E
MLAVWQEWNLGEILRKAWQSGIILAGMSAGAICWFEFGASDSSGLDKLSPLPGLGLINGSCTPHYDGKLNRRPDFHQLVKKGEMPPGIGIDDGVVDANLIELSWGSEYLLKLGFDREAQGQQVDFRPILPLTFSW